jgi:prepilin-type N-terminal cleavage/methylation domain-containing protein
MGRGAGFTLLELVVGIVLMGILAGLLAPFYRNAGEMFADTRARTELAARGRLALERLSRELREAHPGQIQTSASSLSFRQLEDLLSLDYNGSVPVKTYRVCTDISINHLGNQLDWDIDDDGSSDAVLVEGVDAVTFTYTPGSALRSAVVSIDLDLSQGDESIRLFREIHIRNTQGQISCP